MNAYRAKRFIMSLCGIYWGVDEAIGDNDLALCAFGFRFVYYKDHMPLVMFLTRVRKVHKREFGESIAAKESA